MRCAPSQGSATVGGDTVAQVTYNSVGASRGHSQTRLPLITDGAGTFTPPPEKPGISPTERKGVRKVQNLIRFSLKSMRKIRITNMIEFSWK